jgi:hypothetical protein
MFDFYTRSPAHLGLPQKAQAMKQHTHAPEILAPAWLFHDFKASHRYVINRK